MKPNGGLVLAVIFTGFVSFFFGALFVRVFPNWHSQPIIDLGVASVGALAGTAAGAWVALAGDRKKREQQTEDERVAATNIAIFNLNQIYDYLWHYNRLVIEPQKSNPMRWYEISRSNLFPPELEPFDVGRLAFLFEGESPDLPSQIAAEFRRFSGFLTFLSRVMEINEEIQVAMRKAKDETAIALGAIEFCNSVTKQTLQRYADDISAYGDQLRSAVPATAAALRKAMLRIYPGRIIVPLVEPSVSPT